MNEWKYHTLSTSIVDNSFYITLPGCMLNHSEVIIDVFNYSFKVLSTISIFLTGNNFRVEGKIWGKILKVL